MWYSSSVNTAFLSQKLINYAMSTLLLWSLCLLKSHGDKLVTCRGGVITVGAPSPSVTNGWYSLSCGLITNLDVWMTDVMIVNLAGGLHGETSGGFLPSHMTFFMCRLYWDTSLESVDVLPWKKKICLPLVPLQDSSTIFIKNQHRHTAMLRWTSQIQQSSKASSDQAARNQTGFIILNHWVAAEMTEGVWMCSSWSYTWIMLEKHCFLYMSLYFQCKHHTTKPGQDSKFRY